MHDTYDLIGGYGAAKAILTQPLGTIGFLRYDGEVRTVFLRAHDSAGETATGEIVVDASAYLADHDPYGSIEDLVRDSDATFARRHGDILAWQITTEGLKPLCCYDDTLTSDDEDGGLFGNGKTLADALASLPPGCGFLIGDYTSPYSAFILGFRESHGTLSSGCGPAITAEAISDTEDMSDVPDDTRAEVHALQVSSVVTRLGGEVIDLSQHDAGILDPLRVAAQPQEKAIYWTDESTGTVFGRVRSGKTRMRVGRTPDAAARPEEKGVEGG